MKILFIYRPAFTALWLALLLLLPAWVQAAPPDLTAAGVIATLKTDPYSSPVYGETYNLGPTGLRGWIYISSGDMGPDDLMTGESRQILVTVASTPGSAVLAVDDVILGAMAGSSGTVPLFTSDSRKAIGAAIGDAEKTGAGTLRVKRWRAGITTDVNIAMTIMGNYADTAPYSCPKSALILANARTSLVSQLVADPNFLTYDYGGAISGLALLAGVAPGDADYATVQTRLQTFARALAATTPNPEDSLYIWDWGYIGLFLGEYYLSTNDANVVAGLNNYTVALAKVQSRYGTYGHKGSLLKADGSLHGTIGPYGPVNQAGLPANLAIVMGKKALLAANQPLDPEIDPAIQRGANFFAWYVNKGPIPYGEHDPFMAGHSPNGKDALCAVLFGLQANRTAETEYFSRMTTAGFNGREYGHTGQGFSYLWGAMGANVGGTLAVAQYLKPVRWHLDLERRTDGSFVYDGQEQFGAGKTKDGTYLGKSGYYDINPTASYILTYGLPLQRLHITGKNANPVNILDSTKVANAIAAATFDLDCHGFTTTQLIAALSEFDPVVRNYAAIELATRTLSPAELTTLRGMVTGSNANGRQAACQTLGLLRDATALPLITQRLDKNIEPDSWVRAKAASALRSYDSATASTQRDPMLTAFAANATDPDVIVWDDPIQISNGYLGYALFGGGGNGSNNIAGYTINASKSLFYPAVQTGLKQPDSRSRSGVADFCYNYLTLADVQALIPDLIEVVETESQADTMWSMEPRASGIATLAKYKIAEGIPEALDMLVVPTGFDWGCAGFLTPALNALATYGDAARWTLPTLRGYLGTWAPASSQYTTLVSTIASIEAAITAASQNPGLAVANSQTVATTGAKAITLTGSSPRTAVTFTNVTAPAHGSLTGTAPNLTYTPAGGYTGPDRFTFQVTDGLTTSVPGSVSLIVGTAGSGLKGEYFDNANFTNLKVTRTDAQVNFDWGSGSPDPSIGADTFSVRWSGLMLAPETGTYTFSTLNSDGVRLYVNGAQVIDDYMDQTTGWTDSTPVYLTAGQLVDLQMEYYENTGSAVAKLKWTGPSFAGANGTIIGTQWLYDGTGMPRTPYAHAQSLTMVQNTAQAITLQGSGGTLTYTLVTPPAHGTLTGTAPNLTYTPTANYNGTDSFTFSVNNGTSISTPATVSLSIWAGQPVSYTWNSAAAGNWSVAGNWASGTAPAATGQPYYSLNFTPAGTYTVTDDLNSGFQLNQLNMGGAVTLAGSNSLAFTANGSQLPQFNQNSSSAVTLSAPVSLNAMTTFGGSNAGAVAITSLISGTGGLTKNNPGTLQLYGLTPNTYSGGTIVNTGTLHLGAVINGSSPVVVNPVGTGTVTLNGGTIYFDYVTASNALIANGGTLYIQNGWGAIWSGPVTLNAALTCDVVSTTLTCSGTISGTGGLFKIDSGNLVLSGTNNNFTGTNNITAGTLTCSTATALGTGPLSISSAAKVALNYTGTRSILLLSLGGTPVPAGTYGSSASTATNKNDTYFSGTGTVTVSDSVPVATAQSVTTAEDTAKPITLTATDADGNALTYTIVTQPAHGTLSGTAPNVTYTPELNYNGPDSFTFKVNDGTVDSAPATVSITVTPVNDAPVATAQSVTTSQDTAKAIILQGTDVDGDPLTYAIVTQPAHGTLSGTAPNVTYTPASNYNGADSFTFKVNDGTVDSAPAMVTITVNGPQTTFTGASGTDWNTAGNWDAGLPGGSFNMIIAAGRTANNASATPATATGRLVLNSASVITVPDNAAAGENNVVTTPSSIEFIGGSLDLTSQDAISFPALTMTGTGKFTGSVNTGDSRTRNLNKIISGTGQLTIEGRNKQTWSIGAANSSFSGGLALTAIDRYIVNFNAAGSAGTGDVTVTPRPTGTPRSAVVVLGANNVFASTATLTLNGKGNNDGTGWTYTGDTAIDMKTYNATVGKLYVLGVQMPTGTYTGGSGTWITGTGVLTVTSVNTAPAANPQSVTTAQGITLPITLSGTDAEGSALTYSIVTGPTHGTLGGTAPNVTYTPAAGYSGADSFTFKANDGSLDSAAATVSIAVTVPSATTLASSQVASGTYGTAVTFTATVTTGATGTVTFKDGTTVLGTGTLNAGTATFATSALAAANHSITASYGGDTAYSGSASAPSAYVVTPRSVTITGVTAVGKIYDGNATTVLTGGALWGVISGEAVTMVAGSGTFASANAGTWTVTASGYSLSGANAGNYVVSPQPAVANATITPRPVQVTGNGTRVYDATATATPASLTITNKVSGDDLTLTGSATLAGKDVGPQGFLSGFATPARVGNAATGNTGANAVTSFTVTMSASPASGNTLVAVITTRGYSANRVSSIFQTGVTWTKAPGAEGVNTSSSSGSTTEIWYGSNVTVGAGTAATINFPAATTLRAAAVVAEYSGLLTASPLDVTASSSNASNNITAATGTTANTTQANELWIGGIGLRDSTYNLGTPTNAFTQVASANSTNNTTTNTNAKAFFLDNIVTSTGAANTSGTITSSRWSGAIATFKAAPLLNVALSGTSAPNYTLTGATGAVTITPKALTVTAGNQSKTYGQTLAFGSGTTQFTSSGLQSGETIGSVTLACAGGGPAAAAASYPITPSAATGGTFSAGNYTIGYVPGTLTVKPLTMAAYEAWAGGAAFDADTNNNGIANGLAWLLGAADPSADASALLPKPANDGGKLVLTFRCLKTANRGAAVLKVQYTNDLGQPDPWTSHEAVVPDADGTVGGVVFATIPDADPAFINVRAEIPASAASPAGRLFCRLNAAGN